MQVAKVFRRGFSSRAKVADRDVVCVSFSRTPIGRFGGALSAIPAPLLASYAIQGALDKCKSISKSNIDEIFLGNVCSAGVGQAPARQAAFHAGMEKNVPCTTVNKVCASGMKSAMLASLSISAGYRDACIAGGMESMSNIPYYLPSARTGYRLGHNTVVDGVIQDGLWDPYHNQHMGMCAEACSSKYGITREQQDEFAQLSYARTLDSWATGKFKEEVTPVPLKAARGEPPKFLDKDEEPYAWKPEKFSHLRPAFKEGGVVTPANSSKINDGAAAMILVSGKLCRELNLTPLFRVLGYGDAENEPVEFTTAPAAAVPLALKHAGVQASDIDLHEINEAFAVVALANMK